MANKSLTECNISELLEKHKKYEFVLKLVNDEINRRRSTSKPNITNNFTSKKSKSKSIYATRGCMKSVLQQKNITFKESMKKAELEVLIKKHNLVRQVEEMQKLNNKK